tara:strand:+ start:1235 stop:2338 length:1104 start_codon:yes stop_codon:yes gene_type:complete
MAYASVPKNKAHFTSVRYTGSDSTTTISGLDFQPDLVWTKNMDTGSTNWNVVDSSRGNTSNMYLNTNDDQETATRVASFTSDGLTLTGNESSTNDASDNYITQLFKMNGGTTSSNTNGSITSTVQANTTAGMSIVTYTGTGANATVGHGLGQKPDYIIVKKRDTVEWWAVYASKFNSDDNSSFSTDPETDYIELGHNAALVDNAQSWNDTAPTNDVFSVGTGAWVNGSGATYVAYCFVGIKGFSHIGLYRGNGQNDSAFIYTGGKPRMVLIKSMSTGSWVMQDYGMNYNRLQGSGNQYFMTPENTNAKEAQTSGQYSGHGPSWIDFRANGFKIATSNAWLGDGYKYLYIAFLEEPIVSTNKVPATAR